MRKVTQYPAALKENLISKALAPHAPSIVELAKEFNIPYATFQTWMFKMRKNQRIKQTQIPQRPKDRSAESKLQAVIETMNKPEQERAAYCRQHGIYPNHLDAWKKQILEGLGTTTNAKEHKAEHQKAAIEIKKLKGDLHRKDKALAEVSALLILKKKADLLWGETADD